MGNTLKHGDPIRVEYIRPGKEVTYYDEDFRAQDKTCIRTFKTLPEDVSERLSEALTKQNLIQPHQKVGTISKVYFFAEPFNLLEFQEVDGTLLGYYSDIGEPAIRISENEIQMTDLYLDIWLFPNGKLLELDWGEFEEAIEKQVITPSQADLARGTMKRLVDEVQQGVYPSKYISSTTVG